MKLPDQILELRKTGMSYNKIAEQLGCNKSTVAYHCGVGQKEKSKERNKINRSKRRGTIPRKVREKVDPVLRILRGRIYVYFRGITVAEQTFTAQNVIDKVGLVSTCPYTGDSMDLRKPETYHLDHTIPVSKGGENSIDNLTICSPRANIAKSDFTPEEFIAFCKLVSSRF